MRPVVAQHLVRFARKVIPIATAAASILAVVVSFGILWMLTAPSATIFDVVAETERVEMDYRGDRRPSWRWIFEEATIRRGAEEKPFSGSVQLGVPVAVLMERIGFGPLWISVRHETSAEGRCTGATLFGMDEEVAEAVPCEFDILVPDAKVRASRGQTTLLRLDGEITAGSPIGFQTQGTGTAVLRSGNVTLRQKTWLIDDRYDADTIELGAGDFFRVERIDQAPGVAGVALVDERPALRVAFRVAGKEANVVRPGGGVARLSTPILARFAKDRVLQALIAIIGMLVGCVHLSEAIVGGLDQDTKTPPAAPSKAAFE